MSYSIRKEIFILLLCLLMGFALRFYAFDRKSLWLDEIHTYNDSRDHFKGQMEFYKNNPTYLHPPLFFILTHQFYPFTKPEKDLRILPLLFGTLSIAMIYSLARLFSRRIAIPCALSLTFMTYHISLSQEGRSYTLLMFLGLTGLYFLMKHLQASKKTDLFLAALFFSVSFYTSYSSIPFIILSQMLWFYQFKERDQRIHVSSFLIFNGLIFLFCLPWCLFIVLNFKGQPLMDPFQTIHLISFWKILYGTLHDWVPHIPLMIVSIFLLIVFPFLSRNRKDTLLLISLLFAPIGGLYLFCKIFTITHFITSRYFINFLPLFLITLYLSLNSIEGKFIRLNKLMRLNYLFIFLFIASNLVILPLYYHSEKEDFRGLVNYLKGHLREGDKLFDVSRIGYIPGVLHYFGVYPEGRHYTIPFSKYSDGEIEYRKSFTYQNRLFTIYHSNRCCNQYISDGGRLWIIAGIGHANKFKKHYPFVLKGYFDGSFLNLHRFPTDGSLYLFLWDPNSQGGKGIDMLME